MMTTFVPTADTGLAAKFRTIFKPRDIFLHDGKSLRRFTIGARLQIGVAAALLVLIAWSTIATISALRVMNSDVARMERRVEQMETDVAAIRTAVAERSAQLEARQVFFSAMLSGNGSPQRLSARIPQRIEAPTNPAALAMAQGFDRVDAMQVSLAARAEAVTRQRYSERAASLRARGFEPARFHAAAGMGGPYEPVSGVQDNADPRFRALFTSWRALDQLEQGAADIPSGRPIVATVNFTSGFGVRSDPFQARAAMHPGIDLAGPIGTPVYATADGVVDRSEWNRGGYGNLIEIDHGRGIQTRFGHLSQRIVQIGQRVRRGQLLGLMGSTGRSTGSHLHYEVRIDGRAVNPIPFLQPSGSLAALQRTASATGAGGPAGGSR